MARLRRILALRAMSAVGMSQRQVAEAAGITKPAVSQQLKFAPALGEIHAVVRAVRTIWSSPRMPRRRNARC